VRDLLLVAKHLLVAARTAAWACGHPGLADASRYGIKAGGTAGTFGSRYPPWSDGGSHLKHRANTLGAPLAATSWRTVVR